jgi:hypothetical protein
MATHIIVNHDDQAFFEALADSLRAKGCDVVAGTDPAGPIEAPRITGTLELTVAQSTGSYPGVRIRVTGLPTEGRYAGVLGSFLREPVTVADVVQALGLFNV